MTVHLFDTDFKTVNFYKEIDLPPVPNELVESLSSIKNLKNLHPAAPEIYETYHVSENLQRFLQTYFKNIIVVRYQIIRQALPIHKDNISGNYKLNYILDLGGNNVETRWFDNNEKTILEKTVFKKNAGIF